MLEHPGQMSLIGLSPVIGAGLLGGFVSGILVPTNRIRFASIVGLVFAAVILVAIFGSGRHQFVGGNPLFWYWPAWFVPTFAVGGLLSQRVKDAA